MVAYPLMNKDQLRKTRGFRVRLVPIAHSLDARGFPLPEIDDEWLVEDVTEDGVRLSLPRTGHVRTLGFDNVHHFSSDRQQGGITYGFYTLNVQLLIQGNDVRITPTRPGESIAPKIPPDPIRVALLRRLYESPTAFVAAGELPPFPHRDVIAEITRCDAEGLIEARLLRGGNSIVDAVALRLKPRGVEWLSRSPS